MQAQTTKRARYPNYYEIREGDRFGRLVALEDRDPHNGRHIHVRCDCGTEKRVAVSNLVNNTRSCGCLRDELRFERAGKPLQHGHAVNGTSTPTYSSWHGMHKRCTQPSCNGYENYGGRGITVCERWHDFANFLADMGERPEDLTLDRIDVDGDYEPGNCRWATRSVQRRNKRKALTLKQVLDEAGVPNVGRQNSLARRVEHLLSLLEKHGIPLDEKP